MDTTAVSHLGYVSHISYINPVLKHYILSHCRVVYRSVPSQGRTARVYGADWESSGCDTEAVLLPQYCTVAIILLALWNARTNTEIALCKP